MSKVLILEDNKDRIDTLKKKLKDHDLYFFDDVQEAVQAYALLGPFDMILLDHDLDDKIFVESNEPNTGYQFALFLSQQDTNAQIVIHSMNAKGAQNMKDVLPQAEVIPFHILKKALNT